MMNDMKAMRFLAVLAIGLMSVMSVKAQGQRMLEFQVMMSMHDTIYKNFIKDGKHKEAIAPLTTLINILDTTTICRDTEMSPEMVKAAKADYLYDLACCYALTKQKKQALMTLEKSVDSGYKRYDNILNDNDLVSLRKDKKYQALLAVVKDRQPLSVLRKSAHYAPGRETADYRSFGEADVQTFCQIFDRLSNEGISDPAELYRKGILEYLKIYE